MYIFGKHHYRNHVYSITLLLLKPVLDLCMAAGPNPKDNVYKSHPQPQTWAAEVSLLVVHKMFALLICHSLTRYLFSLPFCWSQRRSPVSALFFRLPGVKPYVTCFLFPFAPYLAFGLGWRRQYTLYISGFSCWGNGDKMLEIYTYMNEYIKWIFPDSQITRVLVCILNGTILGLCSGKRFASLTAGPFDVLLQSPPVAVSSSHICSHLLCCLLSSTARCPSWPCVSLSLWICTHTGV